MCLQRFGALPRADHQEGVLALREADGADHAAGFLPDPLRQLAQRAEELVAPAGLGSHHVGDMVERSRRLQRQQLVHENRGVAPGLLVIIDALDQTEFRYVPRAQAYLRTASISLSRANGLRSTSTTRGRVASACAWESAENTMTRKRSRSGRSAIAARSSRPPSGDIQRSSRIRDGHRGESRSFSASSALARE